MSTTVKVIVWLVDHFIEGARWADRLLVKFLGLGLWVHGFVVRWTTRPRNFVWRWWHYSFKEPLTAPHQARDALREMASYRLGIGSHRIARIRVGVRRWRLGVTVTVQGGGSRAWTQQWVRWIDDPVELWLLRSAVQPPEAVKVTRRTQTPEVARTTDRIRTTLLEGDIDSLLGIKK